MAAVAAGGTGSGETPGGGGALVLIGFMGAGKSTAARAASMFSEVHDVDLELEEALGSSISEFFEAEGEQEFRRREEALICNLLDSAGPESVIALGGGALGSSRTREALGRHAVIWLHVSLEQAWDRVAGDPSRPLAADRKAFEDLFAERTAVYEGSADAIIFSDGPARTAEAIGWIAARRDELERAKLLWCGSEAGTYPVWIGREIIGRVPSRASGRRFCVTDSTVGEIYADQIDAVETIVVDAGESSKSLATAESVWQQMADMGVVRSDHLVALGGGVVGDLGGFCAASYQRGIELVQIPTSLVAQVDSAYGGKTGVDLPTAKNFVGAYHPPVEVVVDLDCLATLPEAEAAAGWAEVVKTALLEGGDLWEQVKGFDPAEMRDPEAMEPIVSACARVKLSVVVEDAHDSGRRQILNLGHTIGHGIETAGNYSRHRHGEAVSLGLLAALRLSEADELRSEVRHILAAAGLPVALPDEISTDQVVAALAHDKKRDSEGVKFVLLDLPGAPRWGELVDDADIRASIDELRED
jgi:shikimate kinase/3-dehydroquinate synthase